MIPLQSCMEQVREKKSEEDVTDWECRMGAEEATDSGFLMEEDVEVELDSGYCMNASSELSLAGQISLGSDEEEQLDWFVITNSLSKEQKDGRVSPGGDGGRQTQEEDEIEDDSVSMKNVDTEAERGVEIDDEDGKEEETKDALEVCLQPVEERGVHVRISVEEVERYYKFSRSCYWLCGRCHKFDLIFSPLLYLS